MDADSATIIMCAPIRGGFFVEAKAIFSIAWAISVTSFLQFFAQSVSIIMCGHLSTIEMDSVALANTLVNVLGVNIIGGMSTAFDTFFSQTYGSGNKKGVGIYLQRALILSYLVLLCLYCIHINIEPILVGLGQDKLKALMASQYILLILPGLFFDFNFQTLAKYLQNQDRVVAPLLCAVAGNVVNGVSQYLCLFVFHYNYLASAICQSASFGLMFLLEISYILISGVYKETWDGWKLRGMMQDWGEFMRIAIPGILLIAFEAWCFEIGILVSGLLGTIEMAVQAVIFQLEAWTFMLPLGLSIAVSIRIGQFLGATDHRAAAFTYRVGMFMSLTISFVVASLVLSLRGQLPAIFTKNKAVQESATSIMPIFAAFNFLVGIAHITSGALRGCGHQLRGAAVVFIGYYALGLPVGITLALKTSLKVTGYWIGLTIANIFQAIGFLLIMWFFINWEFEALKAETRSNKVELITSVPTTNDPNASQVPFDKETSSSSLKSESFRSECCTLRPPCVCLRTFFRHDWLVVISIVCGVFILSALLKLSVSPTWRPICIEISNETRNMVTLPLPFCNDSSAYTATNVTIFQ